MPNYVKQINTGTSDLYLAKTLTCELNILVLLNPSDVNNYKQMDATRPVSCSSAEKKKKQGLLGLHGKSG